MSHIVRLVPRIAYAKSRQRQLYNFYGPTDAIVFGEGGTPGDVLRHGAFERAGEELCVRKEGLLNRCDGSARFVFGNTNIIAGIYGPVQGMYSRLEKVDRATIEVMYSKRKSTKAIEKD